ncbi:MAG TPA: PEP-CTERM sorting domain-containing protein [Pirellulales bacterium]|jgi:hypothetical protein
MATSAQAVQLVVMAVNSNIGIAGAKAFTIGLQVTTADVAANPGTPDLFVQNISITGNALGPIQAGGVNNVPDIQTAWTFVDANSPNSISNGGSGGPSFPTAGAATTALYKDSWWYSSDFGSLQGINGFANDGTTDNFGTVSTVDSGQGVYAQGPAAAMGTTGYLFRRLATGVTGGGAAVGGNNADMGFSGIYGPLGQNRLDQAPLASQFVNGVLTVPLAQIISKGDIHLPDFYNNGAGQFIGIGGTAYNYFGGVAAASADPGVLTIDFATGQIAIPEPSSLILAAFGGVALLAYRRRR